MNSDGVDFDAVWRDVSAELWRAIYAYTGGSRDIADDAVVEAFARALAQDGHIRDAKAYLYRIAFREAARELRARRRDLRATLDRSVAPPEVSGIIDALRHLSPSQRAAVYLHYEVDLAVRDVAALMGTSPAAVKVHLMRGRRRLASLLSEDERD